jgi:mono/diheme cytochrome c family protein
MESRRASRTRSGSDLPAAPGGIFTPRFRSNTLTAALLSLIAACGSDAATSDGIAPPPPTTATPNAGTPGVTTPPTTSTPVTPAPGTQVPPDGVTTGTETPGTLPQSPDGAPVAQANILPCGVSKIMVNSCQSCHGATPIGGAPMALVTFDDFHKPANTQPTRKVYELVKERVHDKMRPMPPIGELTTDELAAIDNWVAGGALTGPATDAMCDTTPTNPDGTIKETEHTFGRITPGPNETCYEFKVHQTQGVVDDTKFQIQPGEYYEQFYFEVPWPANQVATAYATLSDNAQVLHHWLLFSTNELQAHGNHINAPLPTLIGTDPILLAGWAVGGPNLVAPDHVGFMLPDPGQRTINVQWHFYNSTSSVQEDGSSVQICTVPREMREHVGGVTWLGTEDLNGNVWFGGAGMPPMQESTFTTTCNPGRNGVGADESIHIIGFEPHMHRIGKRMTTAVREMDGSMRTIFDEPFVFGSETHYYVDHELKPGQQLVTSCTFFNDNNFGVPFGESSDTEMCYQFTFAYPARSISNGAASLLGVTDTCW